MCVTLPPSSRSAEEGLSPFTVGADAAQEGSAYIWPTTDVEAPAGSHCE